MNCTNTDEFGSDGRGTLQKICGLVSGKLLRSMAIFTLSLFLFLEWKTAIFVTVFLIMHESGHILIIFKLGMRISKISFIPLLGAFVKPEKDFFDLRKNEVQVALMGPAIGFLFVIAMFIAWLVTGNIFFMLVSGITNIFNIFNLLPVGMLDGGRTFRSIIISIFDNRDNGWICYGITGIFAVMSAYSGLFFVTLIMMFMSLQLIAMDRIEKAQAIRNMTGSETLVSFLCYAALLSASVVLMSYTISAIGGKEAFGVLFVKWF
ncbi:MAG: site-2 protease family protein [Candidatus Paceibacterota bacterium]|jgi:Zn-dependent protease